MSGWAALLEGQMSFPFSGTNCVVLKGQKGQGKTKHYKHIATIKGKWSTLFEGQIGCPFEGQMDCSFEEQTKCYTHIDLQTDCPFQHALLRDKPVTFID